MPPSHRLLVTVDCDLRCDDVPLRQHSLDALLDAFAAEGLAGQVTWFLNENDFSLTQNHESFLLEALRRRDTLGVHDHIDFLEGRWELEPILDYCRRSKDAVEAWLAANGRPAPVTLHRMGCLFQRPVVYQALLELGYTTVSDVYPGKSLPNHTGVVSFDNRSMPPGTMPYRHGAENFNDYKSTRGPLLQLPVMHMGLANLDFGLVEAWLAAFERASVCQGMMIWLFHPYEILTRDKTAIDPALVAHLRANLTRFRDGLGLEFASVGQLIFAQP